MCYLHETCTRAELEYCQARSWQEWTLTHFFLEEDFLSVPVFRGGMDTILLSSALLTALVQSRILCCGSLSFVVTLSQA